MQRLHFYQKDYKIRMLFSEKYNIVNFINSVYQTCLFKHTKLNLILASKM